MGLGYRASSMKMLVDVVGPSRARQIMLTARQFTAAEAKDMGLVHHVTAVPELELFTKKLCEDIAANAPLTMRSAKRIIREVSRSDYDAAACRALVKECM